MAKQQFIDIINYGSHVHLKYGNDIIQKIYVGFSSATIDECLQLINSYERNEKLEKLGI